jgi:hypothetical protein
MGIAMGSEYRPDRRVGPTERLNRVGVASEEYDDVRRKNFEKALEKVIPEEKKKKKFTLDVPKKK